MEVGRYRSWPIVGSYSSICQVDWGKHEKPQSEWSGRESNQKPPEWQSYALTVTPHVSVNIFLNTSITLWKINTHWYNWKLYVIFFYLVSGGGGKVSVVTYSREPFQHFPSWLRETRKTSISGRAGNRTRNLRNDSLTLSPLTLTSVASDVWASLTQLGLLCQGW